MRIKIRPRQENQTFSSMINKFHSGKTAFQATHTNQCKKRINYYRPQRSCGQGNVFTGVCLATGGGLPQCMLGCHTPPGTRETPPSDQADTPPGPGRPPRTRETPPGTRQTTLGPGRHTPPPDQADTAPGTREAPPPPGPGRPPTHPREADSSIRSTSGRYASYWNAFLLNTKSFIFIIPRCYHKNDMKTLSCKKPH